MGADSWADDRPAPSPIGTPGAGFAPSRTPAPESTFTPVPGSWDGVSPGAGYRVVMLTAGDDEPTRTLQAAVHEWATASAVDLRTVVAGSNPTADADTAIRMHPDLVVVVGDGMVDPMAAVTPNHLDQEFLVVGAELAEPTSNVTAADWAGASFRGEGLGASSTYNPASFTPERCATAVRAGVAAVLSGNTGLVVWLGG